MAVQPDLILQLAHHIARDFAADGHPGVEVRADARASLNGRPRRDPGRSRRRSGARRPTASARKRWITQAPAGAATSCFVPIRSRNLVT